MLGFLKELLNKMPDTDPDSIDYNERFRQSVVVICSVLYICITPIYTIYYYAVGATFLGSIMVLCTVVAAMNLILIKRTENVIGAAHILAVMFITQVLSECSLTGGFQSPGLVWLVLLPIGTGIALGARAGLIYCGVSILVIYGLYLSGQHWIVFQSVLSDTFADAYRVINMLVLMGVLTALIYGFQRANKRTIESLFAAEKKSRDHSEQERRISQIKSDFLANMSHEIRTPMNGIIAMMHMLLATELTDNQRKYSDVVYNSSKSLLTILNDILDFTKIESGKLEFESRGFDLEIALNDMNTMMDLQAQQKKITYSCRITPEVPPRLKGDPGRLRQVLTNLVGNAIKFTEAGEVSVDVELVSESETESILKFTVNDTGVGIPEEVLPTLFQSFTQADASTTRLYGGTGLGLSISKMLVEQMGGQIGVESDELLGSTFWFTVPFEKTDPASEEYETSNGTVVEQRVLILSDDSSGGDQLKQMLKPLGLTVEISNTTDDALEKIELASSEDKPFAVCFVSHRIRKEIEVFGQHAKGNSITAKTKLVVIVSTGEKGDAKAFETAGYSGYLTRPVDRYLLEDCIRALGGGSGEERPVVTRHSIAESRKYGLSVLVVEDNDTNLMVACELLGRLGYHPDSVRNGKEAVEACQEKKYDLIFMDCQMPVMDGFEATREIRKMETESKDVPVIAMTANALKGVREACIEAGMDDYITKPIEPDELAEKIHIHISGTGVENSALTEIESLSEPEEASDEETVVFDRERMIQRFGGDLELVESILESFFKDSCVLIENIKKAAIERNRNMLQENCHALKGSASNINASLLEKAAMELENKAKAGEISDSESFASGIEDAFNRLKEELSQ